MSRILVVDDAATVRLYHRKVLGNAGWHTTEAANGVEALEQVLAGPEPFDLYVVDVNMPQMDGYTLVRELRSLGPEHQAPVLMVSTEAQLQDASAGFDAGVNAYLVKPSRPHGLVLCAALLLGDGEVARRTAAKMSAAGESA